MRLTKRQSRVKRYEIHDNGGRPFFVEVNGKSVSVSKNMEEYEYIDNRFIVIEKPAKFLFTVKADEVFIGSSNGPEGTKGNTILLRHGNKYLFIGQEIYEFSPVKGDTIVKYYSDIGNSDVPYPYAVGKTHIYILLDKVAVDKSYFDMKKDIYDQYYYEHSIHMCLFGNPKTNICKDKKVYGPKVAEFKRKTFKLRSKLIEKRN